MTIVKKILNSGNTPIGPVHTNYHYNNDNKPKLILICESPSYAEVAAKYPTVCATGKRIYHHLVNSDMISPALTPDISYCYHTHYSEFSSNQIYITNMVRYQADFNTKGKTGRKDTNVRKIWNATKRDLFVELDNLNKSFGTSPVLIACGYNFFPQIKEIVSKLHVLQMQWYITSHPTRSPNKYSSHYNPENWLREKQEHSKLMKKVKNWHRQKIQ